MTDRELMQQALDALTYKKWWRVGLGEPKDPKLEAAITSLNKRLAQPEQEPVAIPKNFMDALKFDVAARDAYGVNLYTTPPAAQRQHVTDGSLCWCDPETSYTDPETGASVVVHKGPQ